MIDKIHQLGCVEGLSMLEAHSAALIICDPPYFQVKGEFDKAWGHDFDAYLSDVRKWAEACRRVLSVGGTLMWYGSYRNIAYTQVILDEMFHLVNSCVLEKVNGILHTIASVKSARNLFCNDERLLIYEAMPEAAPDGMKDAYRFAVGMKRTQVFMPVVSYLRGLLRRSGKKVTDVNKALGTCMAAHWFTDRSQWQMPTEEAYGKITAFLGVDGVRTYSDLREEYERLNDEWTHNSEKTGADRLRRYFKMPEERCYDVLPFSSRSATDSVLYGHATPKDPWLTERLIKMTTRPGDLVVVPFAGCGTECQAAAALGRRFVGFDIEAAYVQTCNRRVKNVQLKML